jgi:hypothetical protein
MQTPIYLDYQATTPCDRFHAIKLKILMLLIMINSFALASLLFKRSLLSIKLLKKWTTGTGNLEIERLTAYQHIIRKCKSKLPFIVLVYYEFADWMLVEEYKNAVSAAVQRLGVKARAAGIHLIFAAQRPDNNVFSMQLRSNLDNRLILKVADEGTSEIALGRKGAEYLLGRGHLVARLSSEPEFIYAQVPFLSDEDLPILVTAINSPKIDK